MDVPVVDIVIPTELLVAFLDDEVCPGCLGFLRGCEICPVCHIDLGPVLDWLEEIESAPTT